MRTLVKQALVAAGTKSPGKLCLAAALACVAPLHATAQEGPAAMIVIDGSGSMAAWLDGAKASKLDMARAALNEQFGKLPPSSAVGLVAFGHRRKGNCGDVEVLTKAEPDALGKTLAALPGVSHTGKGPLVEALRQAAGAIAPGPNRSILVVHDDPDNCNQDACEAAGAIAKSHPGLAINIVTLGAKTSTRAAMSCIATATGGRVFEATDEATLSAGIAEALKVATLDPAVPAPRPVTRPEATGAPAGSGLSLTAGLTSAGEALAIPVHWRVTKEGGDSAPVIDTTAPAVNVPAETGTYIVEAQAGLANAKQTIAVGAGKPTEVRVNFEAGIVKLAADAARQGSELLSVSQLDGSGGGLTPIFVGRAPGATLVLPAGRYDIRVGDGLAQVAAKIDVTAGGEKTIGTADATGTLELEAVGSEGGPAVEALYTVERDDPDAPQGRREIARSAAQNPSFTLAAGTYYVTARTRQVEARDRLAVSAGSAVKKTMVLALSRLSLAAKMHASLSPQSQALKFRVLALDGEPREVAKSAEVQPVLTLPAGRYRVEATLGSENAKAVAETELAAGKETNLSLDIPAGLVTLDTSRRSGAVVEVMDDSGAVVWHAGMGDSTTAILAPGRYRYRTADAADGTFNVQAGERQTLRVR